MNQEVLAYLRAFISYSQFEWSTLLPTAQLAINNRNNSTSGLSPFFLEHGYHVEPIQQISSERPNPLTEPAKRASKLLTRI